MATIGNIANKKECGSGVTANTGKLGCLSLFGTPTHALLISKGFHLNESADWNIESIKQLTMKGHIVPLIGASAFEDVSSEDTYSTSVNGVKRLSLKGLPEYKLTFEEGHEFYRQIDRLRGFKDWDVILGDENGNWLMGQTGQRYGGLTAGHLTPEITKRKVAGGDAESKSIMFQFLDRLQFDRYYAILNADELDFYPEEILAINGVDLDFNTVPSNGDTQIVLDVALNSDHSTGVLGIDPQDLYVKVNGATATLGTVTQDNGFGTKYTVAITSPTLNTNDTLEVGFGNVIIDNGIGNVGYTAFGNPGELYRAFPTLTGTVIL